MGFYRKAKSLERLEKNGRKTLRKLLPCKVVFRFVLQGKIFISLAINSFMTLEEFLRDNRRKGTIPISYKEFTNNLEGTTTMVRYLNPAFKVSGGALAGLLERRKEREDGKDDIISKLYDEQVIVRTKDGYHIGRLAGHDDKFFMLENYQFTDEPLECISGYPTEKKAIIPLNSIISISKIPEYSSGFS